MPVDTREKRASAVGHFYTVLPLPDAAVETAADRAQVSWVYSAFGALVAISELGRLRTRASSPSLSTEATSPSLSTEVSALASLSTTVTADG